MTGICPLDPHCRLCAKSEGKLYCGMAPGNNNLILREGFVCPVIIYEERKKRSGT